MCNNSTSIRSILLYSFTQIKKFKPSLTFFFSGTSCSDVCTHHSINRWLCVRKHHAIRLCFAERYKKTQTHTHIPTQSMQHVKRLSLICRVDVKMLLTKICYLCRQWKRIYTPNQIQVSGKRRYETKRWGICIVRMLWLNTKIVFREQKMTTTTH